MTTFHCPECGYVKFESHRCPNCRNAWMECPAEARIEALEKEINVGEAEGDIGAHRLVELRAILAAKEKIL